ncbi:MAG: hypothetical protein K2O03_02210 [Lachnospiraceae bacterium]|nr:hypothetical protein [Lachnospiraceae bacterium]
MKIEAWWFENKQKPEDILQPEWSPRTHFGIYAEIEDIVCPFTLCVTAKTGDLLLYKKEFVLESGEQTGDSYESACYDGGLNFTGFAEDVTGLPEEMFIEIKMPGKTYRERIACEYARLYGKITDFDGNPFPAPVMLARIGFAGGSGMGVWSNQGGEYSIVVPKGCYNTFYVDDNSYGVSTLENWSWHMIVDRDEEHNFKVGNGEVYSLSLWSNNGGSSTQFFWFRPMILPSIKKKEYEIELGGEKRNVTDISPELKAEDITVTRNGVALEVISLQKIYETGNSYTMPSYIVQTKRDNGLPTTGKQTVILEYDTAKRGGEQDYIARSQGRCQFYYKDMTALSLK